MGWRSFVGVLIAALLLSFSAPAASAARWQSCKGFTYRFTSEDLTYRFYDLRATGTSCRQVRRVIRGYFRRDGRPVNPDARAEGFIVYGWNFWIGQLQVDAHKGAAKFRGRYR